MNQRKKYKEDERRRLPGICLGLLLAAALLFGASGKMAAVRAETTGKEKEQLQLYAQAAVLLDADFIRKK